MILLLSLHRVNSAGPRFIMFYIQSSTRIPELSKSKNKENDPCKISESYFSKDLSSAYPVTAALTVTVLVTPSHLLQNFPAVPDLPSTPLYHLLCQRQPVSWLYWNYTFANWLWLAGWPIQKGGGDAQCWIDLSPNDPLGCTNSTDTSFRYFCL